MSVKLKRLAKKSKAKYDSLPSGSSTPKHNQKIDPIYYQKKEIKRNLSVFIVLFCLLISTSGISQIGSRRKGHRFSLCFKAIDLKVERPIEILKCQFGTTDGKNILSSQVKEGRKMVFFGVHVRLAGQCLPKRGWATKNQKFRFF